MQPVIKVFSPFQPRRAAPNPGASRQRGAGGVKPARGHSPEIRIPFVRKHRAPQTTSGFWGKREVEGHRGPRHSEALHVFLSHTSNRDYPLAHIKFKMLPEVYISLK